MPIDLPPEEFRRLGYRAVDLLTKHFAALSEQPARTPVPDALRRELMEQPLPEDPANPDALLDEIDRSVLRYPMGNNSPRFFAWVNSSGAPLAVLAEMLAAGLNPSVAGGDHAATYVEHAALAWMRRIMGFPRDSGAILTSGGSDPLIVYTSTEGHSCIQKAIELLGIGHAQLRRIPVDADWRMDVGALQSRIAEDRAAGLVPACVAASAGTVNTGAIDPLAAIADLCQREGLWFHVDGAYGGPAALAPELADVYRGLERADSVAVDPHKWMYVPVECGCALVRNAAAMRDTFSLVPPYLRDDTALPWFAEFGIQQSRGFRALKLWTALRHVGVKGYRELLAHDLAMTRELRDRLRAAPDFEVIAAGPLSITCFRYRPASFAGTDSDLDALNKRILERVQHEGRVYLTGTELHRRPALRACIVNFRTQEGDLDALLNAIRESGADVA